MMEAILIFLICFAASLIGAICGIGGGVIIKPCLDAFRITDVSTISFLSGCTVLTMSAYSVFKAKRNDQLRLRDTEILLAVGAAIGGIVGKRLFVWIMSLSSDPDRIGAIQAASLILVTLGTILYTLRKTSIRTRHCSGRVLSLLIGLALGIMSSFLGIGGGPINLVVLYYFYDMQTKQAASCSLYIIFCSQITSLLYSVVTRSVPTFSMTVFLVMVFGGLLGGIAGRVTNRYLSATMVERLFLALMFVIVGINIYNITIYI